jgi:hypothetical protein
LPTASTEIVPLCIYALLVQVVTRIFPLRRGLFEDYVSNFWCATSVAIKWKQVGALGGVTLQNSSSRTYVNNKIRIKMSAGGGRSGCWGTGVEQYCTGCTHHNSTCFNSCSYTVGAGGCTGRGCSAIVVQVVFMGTSTSAP